MNRKMVALGIGWLPLLGGCMGMAPGGHVGAGVAVGHGQQGPAGTVAPVHAEASNGELVIALSLWAPSPGAAADIDVRLVAESAERDMADREVQLRILTPQGGVDEIVMNRIHSSSGGIYHARYVFRSPGPYQVTAEAWSATADVPVVSVTAEADVLGYAGDRHDWLMPVAIVGGLAMVTMMVVMMAH